MKYALWMLSGLLFLGAGCTQTPSSSELFPPSYETTTIESEDERVVVNIEIPIVYGFPGSTDAVINQTLYDLLTGERDTFIESLEEPGEDEMKSSFSVVPDITMLTNDLVSMRLGVSTYVAGAAHPYSWTDTFTYDVSGEQELDLDDIFEPETDYRVDLWQVVQKELGRRAEENDFPEVAEGILTRELPDPTYFQKFTIAPDHLTVYFDAYEIGPYAWGPQQVDISWTKEIKDLLKDEGTVSKFLRSSK